MTWKKVVVSNVGIAVFVLGFGPIWVSHWLPRIIGYGMIFGGLLLTLTIVLTPCRVGDTTTAR